MTPDPVAQLAERDFGLKYLYPIQRLVIANVLEGADQIVVLPTGAGKSLCFQLPSRVLDGITLVVVPLLSLLEDQLSRCRQAALPADALEKLKLAYLDSGGQRDNAAYGWVRSTD